MDLENLTPAWQKVIAFAILVGYIAVIGVVLSTLWSWHVSPVFNLPPMSVGSAIGLVSLYIAFAINLMEKEAPTLTEATERTFERVKWLFFCLALGYVASFFK